MRKLGWYAVSAVVAAMILGGVLLLAANLYVQSHAVQEQIQRALVSALKMPVEIKKTTLTPWEGLRIDSIAVHPEGSAENFLTAESFRVRFAFFPLLRKRLIVEQVLLDYPELSWAQGNEGRWMFPPVEKPPHRGRDAAPSPEDAEPPAPPAGEPPAAPTAAPAVPSVPGAVADAPTAATETPGATPIPAAPAASVPPAPPAPVLVERPPGHHASPMEYAVEKVKLRHGVLNFLDARRRPVGRFEEVNFDSRVEKNVYASGAVWFGKAVLPRFGVTLTDFRSNFSYNEKGLRLRDGTGQLAGGKINLDYHIQPDEPDSPFSATFHLENVSLDTLITQAGGRPGMAAGRLQGDVSLRGDAGDPASRHGTGKIELTEAQFANLPLLQTIGEALRIEDISHLQFKKARLECALEGTVLHVQPLTLVSNNLQITAQGDYRMDDDRLRLRARLVIDQAVGRQLPQFIESNFLACGDEAPGCRYMDFDITGTLARPKSDLFAKVLSGTASSLLQNLFSPKKKHEKKEPKPPENAQPPSDQDDKGGAGADASPAPGA